MDKDKLIKNHFWILLGLALVLLPVVMIFVLTTVGPATAAEQQKIDGLKSKLGSTQPKGANYQAQIEKYREKFDGMKDVVWKDNYEAQKGLIEWPYSLSDLNKLYFGDTIPDRAINEFTKLNVYLPEYESLSDLVKPTELTGGWRQVMAPVPWGEKRATTEDVWLALEDLCIQREMMRCVHAVNLLLAQFRDGSKKEVKDKDGVKVVADPEVEKELKEYFKPVDGESVHRFISPYWLLDIAIMKSPQGKGAEFITRGRLRNVSHRRLNVARIEFLLNMQDPAAGQGKPLVLGLEGDFLAVDAELNFSNKIVRGSAPKAFIYGVEQKLDPRYVPVKRVERIVLGYNSHRTADRQLLMCSMSEEAKKQQTASGGDPPPAEATPGVPTPGGQAAPVGDKSNSGINRLRYVACTPQVRRMPIGLVMTVDQAHVQDILRAFANSRLRFQTTQVHAVRARGSGNSGTTSMVSTPPPTTSALVPPVVVPPGSRGVPLPGNPVVPQLPTMTTTPGAGETTEDNNPNLVEVGIYGLASIYEKFPPKTATPADGTTPPASPTPPATTPPAADPAAKAN